MTSITSKPDSNVTISGNYRHRVDLVYGPPNNRTYYEGTYDVLPVAVVEPVPFRGKTSHSFNSHCSWRIHQFESGNYSGRKFHQGCGRENSYRPPGIGARSNIKIAGKDAIGYYPLTANSGTPIGEWEIGVQGEAAANGGGNMLAASEFIKLKVEEPYLQ